MRNFRIESLEINEIGPFEHLKIYFPLKKDQDKAEIHILTGENGTGKSTILEALIYPISYIVDQNQLQSSLAKRLWTYPSKSRMLIRSLGSLFSARAFGRKWEVDPSHSVTTQEYLDYSKTNFVRDYRVAFFAFKL